MTDTSNRNRQSGGQPIGGQFATEARGTDTGVDLGRGAPKKFDGLADVMADLEPSMHAPDVDKEFDLRGLASTVATYDTKQRAFVYRPEFDENSPEFDPEAFGREVARIDDGDRDLDVPPLGDWESEADPFNGHHYNPAARYARGGTRVDPDRSKVSITEEGVSHPMHRRVVLGNTSAEMSVHAAADWREDTREPGRFHARRAEADGELRSMAGEWLPIRKGDWVVCDHFSNTFTLPDDDYRQVFGEQG